MVVFPLFGLPAKATVILFMIAATYHDLMGHSSAQHHSGAFDINDKRAGMTIIDNRDYRIG